VWRDLPNPSQYAFAEDVKHYRKAGILGVSTESRGASATTFLNLYFRLQLMWDPDANVDAMLAEFYSKFYGPAAAPMANYWNAIFAAWKKFGRDRTRIHGRARDLHAGTDCDFENQSRRGAGSCRVVAGQSEFNAQRKVVSRKNAVHAEFL
jgi:hypothetical protein